MKKEIADKWVAALRSGEYKQGTLDLRNLDDEFCCLGVLCDLAVKENVIDKPIKDSYRYVYEMSDSAGIDSKKVREWSGLNNSLGRFKTLDYNTLAAMNDKGVSFTEIADIIEQNYEDL